MKNLKIWGAAFLMGVGAARVLVWLNTGIAYLLIMRGGWEVAEAVKAAPWVLFALDFGLLLSVSGLLSTGEHYKRSAAVPQSDRGREPERKCPAGCMRE